MTPRGADPLNIKVSLTHKNVHICLNQHTYSWHCHKEFGDVFYPPLFKLLENYYKSLDQD